MFNNIENNSLFSEDNISCEDFDKSFSFININDFNDTDQKSINILEDNINLNKQDETNKIDTKNELLINNNITRHNYFDNKEINNMNIYNNGYPLQSNFINYNNINNPLYTNIFPVNNPYININNSSFNESIYKNNLLTLCNNQIINQNNSNNLNNLNNSIHNNIISPNCKTIYKLKNSKIKKSKNNNINYKDISKEEDKKVIKNNQIKTGNEINIDLLLSGEEKRTCIRLFPIPHNYSPFDIIRIIDKYLKTIPGKRIYDSIYVPLTKKIGKNIGYCFINLVSPKYVVEFYNVFNGIYFKNCKKPCTILFSDKQNFDISEDPMRGPITFKDYIKI